MPGWVHRFRAITAAAALIAGALVPTALAGPAAADACTDSGGVLVVADLRPFGQGIPRGCATAPSSGLAALRAAGFSPEFTHDGRAFICRINGQPTAAQDPCDRTPPASAYWSYWQAGAGQNSWSYSQLGAASSRPGPGGVDAWVFGGGGAPTFSPAQARGEPEPTTAAPVESTTAAPPPPTTQAVPPEPTGSSTSTAPTTAPAETATPVETAGPSATSSAPPTTTAAGSPAASASPSSSSSTSSLFRDVPPPSADDSDSEGSAWPVVLGLALAAALAGAGGYAAWRRRQQAP